jgi:hypothetical protein
VAKIDFRPASFLFQKRRSSCWEQVSTCKLQLATCPGQLAICKKQLAICKLQLSSCPEQILPRKTLKVEEKSDRQKKGHY